MAAAVAGGAAALAAYLVGRQQSTDLAHKLHEELHQVAERQGLFEQVTGRNFTGAATSFQNLAEALNNAITELREMKMDLFRPRAQPGGEEPPA